MTIRSSLSLAPLLLLAASCADDYQQPQAPPPPLIIEEPTPQDNNAINNQPGGAAIGAACQRDADCRLGARCDASQPGGACTQSCDAQTTCPAGAVCAQEEGDSPRCYQGCAQAACRDGYFCASNGVISACVALPDEPEPEPEPDTPATYDQMLTALGADCAPTRLTTTQQGTYWSWRFTLPADASSFLVIPFVSRGIVYPTSLTAPAGLIDLVSDYRHHNGRLIDAQSSPTAGLGTFAKISMDWPILFPYAPQYASYVTPGGSYSMTVLSDQTTPCLVVVPDAAQTKRLDVNLYFVGTTGLSAANAETDPDLREVLARIRYIYGKAGVELGQVRYYDAPQAAQAYSIIRYDADIERLTAYGQARAASREALLSVDVFLVRDITLQGGAVLGSSGGVPGAAGFHGNRNNGLVFSTSSLGQDNHYVAHIMAHEIGHYLGLRHTTEILKGSGDPQEDQFEAALGLSDPLTDTPECPSPYRYGSRCPDFYNLMFPSAPPAELDVDPEVSAAQGGVLRANPLTQ